MVYSVIGCWEVNKSYSGNKLFLKPILDVLCEVQELASTGFSWPETCLLVFRNEEVIINGDNTIIHVVSMSLSKSCMYMYDIVERWAYISWVWLDLCPV